VAPRDAIVIAHIDPGIDVGNDVTPLQPRTVVVTAGGGGERVPYRTYKAQGRERSLEAVAIIDHPNAILVAF
jgi:hypothetical protein